MTGGMTNEHCPDWIQDMIKKITDMKFELPRQSEDFDGHVSKSIFGLFAACQSAVALQRNAVGSTHLAFHFAWHDNCKGCTRYKAQSIPPTHTNPTLAWANKAAKKLKKGGVKRYEKIKDWMKYEE